MGRPKKQQTSGSLDSGECKVVYVQGDSGLVTGLRFITQGRYVSMYLSKEGVECLQAELAHAVRVLK